MLQAVNTADQDRLFYGYRLRSEIALPSLPQMPEPADTPDLILRRGLVPDCLPQASWSSPFVEIGTDGMVLVRIADAVRFTVQDGRDIVLDQHCQAQTSVIETFLFSVVAGIILHQRGMLALHASCVMLGDVAVAMAGVSGRGKSTLAAALSLQGHSLLSDDICPIRFDDGRAMVIPGPARLRLWPDAAQRLGLNPDQLAIGRPQHPKRVLPISSAAAKPMPLAALIRIGIDKQLDAPTIYRLSGAAAITPIEEIVYRARLGRRLGRRIGLFTDLVRLAGIVPVFQLLRPEQGADLPQLADLVRATIAKAT